MPPLKAIEQAQFGGVDSRSNPIVMPAQRWLRCRNWLPRPDGHLDLREGYTVEILEQLSGPSPPSNPGQEIDPASETNHNVSAYSAYQAAGFPPNFTGTSYISTGATTTVDKTLMDDSMNPVTPAHRSANVVHSLIPNFHGRWYAHLTPWFHSGGGGGHIDIGISCTDPTWVANALTDMWWRGFNGCIIDWHGHGDYTDSSTLMIQSYLTAHSLGTTFCIMIDPGAYSTTAQLETQLSYINTQYLSDPNYLTQSGKPVVMFFGPLMSGVDYAAAKASVPRAMFWMFEGPGPATNSYVDGTFGWPNPWSDGLASHPTDPYNFAADNGYLTSPNVAGTSAKPSMPYVSPGFNGTLTKFIAWSLGKYMPRDHGKCWLQKCANVNTHLPANAIGIQVATWNDWEEGTEVESPIQNDIFVTASISGSILVWSVAGGTGDETTLSGYRVIATQGARAFLIYTEGTGGGKTLDLSTVLGWEGGVPYSIYVTAVGVACVRNQFSNTVSYTSTPSGGGPLTGAAYSICPYTVATPDTSSNPACNPPEPPPKFPNGHRCAIWWQKSASSIVTTAISTAITSFDKGGPPHGIWVAYYVDNAARLVPGSMVTVSGVVSKTGTPANFFNGTYKVQSIGGPGEVGLFHGLTNGTDPHQDVLYNGTGGTITSVEPEPGPPVMFLFDLVTRAIISTADAAGTGTGGTIPVKGKPIVSTARWQYALGKDGYLYMHNGTDAKFFDGVCLRDIGLPTLSDTQANNVTVLQGMSAPADADVLNVYFDWGDIPLGTVGPFQPNAISSYMYMAYFDKTDDVLASSTEPLSGHVFPNGQTTPAPPFTWLQVNNLPPPTTPGSQVTLLYYPGQAVVTLVPGTTCKFYPHDTVGGPYRSQFEYSHAGDSYGGGVPLSSVSPTTSPFSLANNQTLIFNPGYRVPLKGWTGRTDGNIHPMVVAGVTSTGSWDGTAPAIAADAYTHENWTMIVEGQIVVPAPGEYTFVFVHDDGALIGFGSGASAVSGYIDPGPVGSGGYQTITADRGYPVMCMRQTSGAALDEFTVNFPTAGPYPFEIDYCNYQTAQTCALYNADNSPIRPGVAPSSKTTAIDPSFLTQDYGQDNAVLSMATNTSVNVYLPGHGFISGDVIVLALHKHPSKTDYPPSSIYKPVTWTTNGPFTVTVIDANNFTFNSTDASLYDGATPITVYKLVVVTTPGYLIDTDNSGWPKTCQNGVDVNQNGQILLPGPLDSIGFSGGADNLIPASEIGGTQPGYLFYACIYNPYTGHVGNRVPIGIRINNTTDCVMDISGLPDFTMATFGPLKALAGARFGYGARNILSGNNGGIASISLEVSDPEWRILIGRTGDGGEIPYACINPDGTWVTTDTAGQTTIKISFGEVDENSELPINNYPPPAFANFWREGDRMCGTIKDQPFVYRCGSELDALTGIFVGDPAQSWTPALVETFPTADAVIGGKGFMQESWVFTRGDIAQLSELTGEVVWNGPYNFGIAGPFAFDKGWSALPYWVSHDKQLCTMLPGSNGPISISTEYETALLSRIGDELDAEGNFIGYLGKTEVVYFRDPLRMIDVLRIKCVDNTGLPFTIIHDFNLRDDASPYGQAYEENYLGILATDYEQAFIRDGQPYPRMWAAASDGAIYQFYTGGLDQADPSDPTLGFAFTADAINLRYLGGERTAAKTLEWYGDDFLRWFIHQNMMDVDPTDSVYWTELSFEMRPVPADEGNAHYMADIQRPEMTHCYLWAQLTAHPLDTATPLAPMTLSVPPHMPLETYGRLYLAAPILGDSRGR